MNNKNSHRLGLIHPHGKLSAVQKRSYSTPKLTTLGTAAQLSREVAEAFLMDDLPAAEDAALREYRDAVEREATAWQAVAMRLPGEPGFDRNAWITWRRASWVERQARAKWEAIAANQSQFGQLGLRQNG